MLAYKKVSIRETAGLPPSRRRSQAGLTLIELLVSLVILGFVMSLVSESIFQVAKIARAADDNTRRLADRWGAGWSASAMFSNLLAPELPVSTPVLAGTETRVSGFTSTPLSGKNTGIAQFSIELRPDADQTGRTTMMSIDPSTTRAAAKEAGIASFIGQAEFRYLDRKGAILRAWPPATRSGADQEDLPRAVIVQDAGSGGILMWYPFAGETIRPTPSTNPFGLPSQ